MVDQAEIHRMVESEDVEVRRKAVEELKNNCVIIMDKKQTWDDIHRLTQDKNEIVRKEAADALGAIYSNIPEKHKKQAWDDMIRLTKDNDGYVRASAYHSLGKASIFKSASAEKEENFKNKMEEAIQYFEKATQERTLPNPASFCLPFYRSFYTITFKKEEVEGDVQKYLAEAKNAVLGSESKEKLFEALNNLSNALNEVQNARDFKDIKSDLNAYRQYCERAADLLDAAEEKAPAATRLIRKGLPMIDDII